MTIQEAKSTILKAVDTKRFFEKQNVTAKDDHVKLAFNRVKLRLTLIDANKLTTWFSKINLN